MKENDFMCPACKMGKLGHTPNNDLQCNICNKIYPKILGIPVLVDEPKKLIALTYWHYLDGLAKIDNQIAELSLSSNFPSNEKQKQVSALTTNKSLLLELKDILEKQFHVSMIPSLRSSDNMSLNYVTNFDYLKRDWTFLPHYEKEISNILENLTASIKSLEGIAKKPKILFLGAGTGRIAYELAKQYSEITAIDRSLLMSSLFQKVQTENIEFCEVTFKNVERESVSNYSIEAKKNITSKIDKVRYVTGDASNLPFQKDNFDIIISVYFSDVLPLGYFFPEVKRVLKSKWSLHPLGSIELSFQ